MNKRTYKVGVHEDGRPTITVGDSEMILPDNVWRDLGRLAGHSYNSEDDTMTVTFHFLIPESVVEAERVLAGAMWVRE